MFTPRPLSKAPRNATLKEPAAYPDGLEPAG